MTNPFVTTLYDMAYPISQIGFPGKCITYIEHYNESNQHREKKRRNDFHSWTAMNQGAYDHLYDRMNDSEKKNMFQKKLRKAKTNLKNIIFIESGTYLMHFICLMS